MRLADGANAAGRVPSELRRHRIGADPGAGGDRLPEGGPRGGEVVRAVGDEDDVVAALDHLGVEKAQIVGHSMGAFVAAVVARRHPDRVSSLLLVDGGLPLELPPGVTLDDLDRIATADT